MSSLSQIKATRPDIISLIKKLDFNLLRTKIGNDILLAAEEYYEKDDSEHLANLVVDKYGSELIYDKDIRQDILDRLPIERAVEICFKFKIKIDNKFQSVRKLKERYSTSSDSRIREFLEIFSLPENDFLKEKVNDSRLSCESVSSTFGENLVSKGVLHPYQIDVKDQIAKLVENNQRRIMVQMPTGAGKTMTALELVVDFVRSHKFEGYIVWIVESAELAEQAFNSFKNLWLLRGDRPISIFRFFNKFENDFSFNEGVVFTTFDKCLPAKEKNSYKALCKKSKCVIVDEAHASCADTYSQIITELTAYDATLIGLSATPTRNDIFEIRELVGIYGNNLVTFTDGGSKINNPIKFLQEQKYLAKIDTKILDTSDEILEKNENRLNKLLMLNSKRNKIIIEQIKNSIEKKESTILFACTVDHVIALNAICKKEGLDVDFITGKVRQVKREEIFERFRKKDLLVILNHEILSTGIDLPKVDKLIITRPIGSKVLYAQTIGRALRGPKNGGNERNTIVNIRDNLINFSDCVNNNSFN